MSLIILSLFILQLCFIFFLLFLFQKRVQILIILSFNLSLIIFGFFSITFLLINRSNHFLIIDLIFFTSYSTNLSISSLDTMIGLSNSFSISLLIFSVLSFNSLPFNLIKSFSNSKRLFFLP